MSKNTLALVINRINATEAWIDLTEEIDVNKSKHIKECIVCHYWCADNRFKFQTPVWNGCHNKSNDKPWD